MSVVVHTVYSPLKALKGKQKVTDQKLQQAEDTYSQAKRLYDELTDELYEELPSFFDRSACTCHLHMLSRLFIN